MKLFKNLNEAIKNREQVEYLKLNLNTMVTPDDLFNFSELKELYLEGSLTNFEIPYGSWPKLKSFSIKLTAFQGEVSSFFNLTALENLKFISTPIKEIRFPLGMVSSPLSSLTIKDCDLTKLPFEIDMLSELKELNLSSNFLSNLPVTFFKLKNLKRLNLDSNKFDHFPDQIKEMKNLTHLSIDGNLFSEDEKARIQRYFNIWPN